MPGIAGFKKGFKKLFNFVKKSDEKSKKLPIQDETKNKIKNNQIIQEQKHHTLGNHTIQGDIQNVTLKNNEAQKNNHTDECITQQNIKQSDTEEENVERGDQSCHNDPITVVDNCKRDEAKTNIKKDEKPTIVDHQSEQNLANKTTKPTAIVKPCQKINLKDQQVIEIDDDSLKKSNLSINREISKESKTSTILDLDVKIEDCKLDEEKTVDHDVKETKQPITEEDILDIDLKLKSVDAESMIISEQIKNVEVSNMQMMTIVEDFEKTLNQLMEEKERDEVCQQIMLDKILNEKEEIVRDYQNVEKAFTDLTDKYERAKNILPGLKVCEDKLKETVAELSSRFDEGEKNFDSTKLEAEHSLAKAEETLEKSRKGKSMEIARLTAQLKKSEMNISSLEKEIDQKNQENKELATMCDDLLAKLDKS